jgi:hypothetical protein
LQSTGRVSPKPHLLPPEKEVAAKREKQQQNTDAADIARLWISQYNGHINSYVLLKSNTDTKLVNSVNHDVVAKNSDKNLDIPM